MQSLWAKGSTMAVKMLLFGIFESCIAKARHHGSYDTYEHIWKILIWSFKALAIGKWPLRNWDGSAWQDGSRQALAGTDLADGQFAVLYVVKRRY